MSKKIVATHNTFTVAEEESTNHQNRKMGNNISSYDSSLPEILFITSYPPRECGIATYSQDLVKELRKKFNHSFNVKVCALDLELENYDISDKPKYILNTQAENGFIKLAFKLNKDRNIQAIVLQHEFGFFKNKEEDFQEFLEAITIPIIIVFHTVLPQPDDALKLRVQLIANVATVIVVMTNASAAILLRDYEVSIEKVSVIPHGTHLVPHLNKESLKRKYSLTGRKVLSTFGLLSSGKSIETTLDALPHIIEKHPSTLFLIIGITHPSVVRSEGERYRLQLQEKIATLSLQQHVHFINRYLPLPDLLEYLQLTDVYLFTSKDRNQAVSGTFSYAISCGCPVVSTPIPHAREVLENGAGIIVDFENPVQLCKAVNSLLDDEQLRKETSSNGLHKMAATAWENTAIAHAMLFEKLINKQVPIVYSLPVLNLSHIKRMTTDFGIIQFSIISHPDINSGYTIDDNARALIAMCQHYELTKDRVSLKYIHTYFRFIKYCLQPQGRFLNYVNKKRAFTEQNRETNLEDSNGRAIWGLGYLVSMGNLLPKELLADATNTMQAGLASIHEMHSTRAMAFALKGLYYASITNSIPENSELIKELADRLVQMYRHEASEEWRWFESYMTYGNSILPEALLCAWLVTGNVTYKETAKASFDFLLTKIFAGNRIKVISNKGWLLKGDKIPNPPIIGGEQPIDVAYTVIALQKFYDVFKEEGYQQKMQTAFNWFLGNNHLHQIIYNPCTGGCYDGLEENYVNLNQGAESTVSYLMARLTLEKRLATTAMSLSNKSTENTAAMFLIEMG